MAGRSASSSSSTSALDAAIDWMVLLRSGEATASDAERHRAWQAADPRHAQAWAQVGGAVQRSIEPLRSAQAGAADGAALQAALLRPPRRRAISKLLAVAGVGAATGWLVNRQWPVSTFLADLQTGTGERRSVTLADGSQLVLNARSAVDIDFSRDARTLRLHAGELIVTAMPDAERPFVVQTLQGSVQALGTRFLVRQEEGRTQAMVLVHSVRLRASNSGVERTLQEGEAAAFDARHIEPTRPAQAGQASWERGMLAADDWPLADVVAALRPYRHGFIRVSPEAARLHVLGAFALDDTDRVLESLAQTLPLRITRYGGWLVTIETRDPR